MVNGQPCMPHWAACFRHRGNVKQFHIYITVYRNVKIQGALTPINLDPWQLLPMKVGPSGGKSFQGCCPKNFSGVQPVSAHKGSNAKPAWATGGLAAMQNNGPNSNGVVSTFQTKVCISIVPWSFECVHSTGVRFRATVVSNLHCEVAPPLIEASGVVKHQNDVNPLCKYFYVLLRNKQQVIWHSQSIPLSLKWQSDCRKVSTYLRWKLLMLIAVGGQHPK